LKLQRLAVALVLVVACGIPVGAFAEGQSWVGWDAGLQQARQLQRPVLVDVYTQWCGWCKRMDRDVYSREDVRDYLGQKFVTVKLDAEAADPGKYGGRAYTSRTLASEFRITSYPTTVFLKPNGEHLVSVPGYIAPERFLLLLRYIRDGHFERGVAWEDFVSKKGK
jgi:thioredoxin-related protein